MKRTATVVALAMLALACVLSCAAKKKGTPEIKFEQTEYNFGTIPENKGTVSHEFVFTNTGTAPLVIFDATAECGCTTPEYTKAPVAPGKTGVIKVTYNPLGRPGGFTKTVTVKCNGKPKKTRMIIKGVVNPNRR